MIDTKQFNIGMVRLIDIPKVDTFSRFPNTHPIIIELQDGTTRNIDL